MKKLDEFTKEEIDQINQRIDNMSHEEMASLWRFAPIGEVIFRTDLPFYQRFDEKFKKLGGFNPQISKKIGWDAK